MALNSAEITAYLSRLQTDLPERANLESLVVLQRKHLLRVPFENLDIHRGRAIVLETSALFDKVVTRGRGGFCYELNGLFAQLLTQLGFHVTLLSAGVAKADGTFGPPFDHLLLRVDLEKSYIVDVGYGDGFSAPLELTTDIEQPRGKKTFKLVLRDGCWTLYYRLGPPDWKADYRFTLEAREFASFAAMCEYHQTSPSSHFTQARLCTIQTHTGRRTLSGNRFIESIDGVHTEREIRDEAELESILTDHFGIKHVGNDIVPGRAQMPDAPRSS